jgi:uncharacterized protein YfdQ (DUF2303 family)
VTPDKDRKEERNATMTYAEFAEDVIRLLSATEFTSLDHMPHEAATLIRAKVEAAATAERDAFFARHGSD